MIKLENYVGSSPEQMVFMIEGMRNPMNSWDRSDSETYTVVANSNGENFEVKDFLLGKNDHELMTKLAKAGAVHRKYMRMMQVGVRITAPLYWWKEFDTYKVGTVANSCSTMHKIQAKEFTLEDFSCEHLTIGSRNMMTNIIDELNYNREIFLNYDNMEKDEETPTKKDIWWQMIQLLPSSYNQTRNVMMNYETLCNIYEWRKDHKLDEWREFCQWIEKLPYSELITENA